MSEHGQEKQFQDEFLKSRDGAIVRCVSILIDSGRKDIARQILDITHINRNRLKELKAQNT